MMKPTGLRGNWAVPLLLALCLTTLARAEIIPAARRIDWTAGTYTGIPGGFPNRTTVAHTIVDYGADPTGVADSTSAINAAWADCPSGQVVGMPIGTYRCDGNLSVPQRNNMTIRGAGMGKTILKHYGSSSSAFITFASNNSRLSPLFPSAGATRGSTVLTLPDTSTLVTGEWMLVDAVNDPPWMWAIHNHGSASDHNHHVGWLFHIISKTGTTVTFSPPMPMDISAYAPVIWPYTISNTGTTLEDFTIDMNTTPSGAAINAQELKWCGFKAIEIKNNNFRSFLFNHNLQCEMRRCYIHDAQAGDGVSFGDYMSFNLYEDNIFWKSGTIVVNNGGTGGGGNVFAYNFLYNHKASSTIAGADMGMGHGTQSTFNLVEGNVLGGIHGGDGYFGGASDDTLLRNWITATNPDPAVTGGLVAIRFKHANVRHNVIGNVLGTTSFPTTNNGITSWPPPGNPIDAPAVHTVADGGWYEAPISSDHDQGGGGVVQDIYQLGFPGIGNTYFSVVENWIGPTNPPDYTTEPSDDNSYNFPYDANVKATLARHGNFDYFSGTQKWESTNTNVTDHTDHVIPVSYFRSARPADWPADWPWPPIDPANPPTSMGVNNNAPVGANVVIPAMSAYYHQTDGIPIWPDEAPEPTPTPTPTLYLFTH